MNITIIVKDKMQIQVFKTELVNYKGEIPRKGETVIYGDGEAATITRVEWDFLKYQVWIICG